MSERVGKYYKSTIDIKFKKKGTLFKVIEEDGEFYRCLDVNREASIDWFKVRFDKGEFKEVKGYNTPLYKTLNENN